MTKYPHLYVEGVSAPTRPVTTTTHAKKAVVRISDRAIPVVYKIKMRRRGKLINHWI